MKTTFRCAVLLSGLLVAQFSSPIQAEDQPVHKREPGDWPLYRGTPSRNGRAEGEMPFLEARWRQATVEQQTTKTWIDRATTHVVQRQFPLTPNAFPIAVTITWKDKKLPLVIYRSHSGTHAIHGKTGELVWKAPSAWSLDRMVSNPAKQSAITTWVDQWVQTFQKPTLPFENSTVGTLSTDGRYLFVIEDLAVSPPTQAKNPFAGPRDAPTYAQVVTDAIQHNKLQAYELARGKLKWELGGRDEKHGPARNAFFLGAPLPVEDKLYCLVEKGGKLLLVSLDSGKGQWLDAVELAVPKTPLPDDPLRRMQASHLAHAAGTLVCPTNAGVVVGVDLKTRKVIWTHSYRDTEARPLPGEELNPGRFGRRFPPPGWVMGPDGRWMPPGSGLAYWQVTAPVIVEDKVVFAAPDSKSVSCVGLRDGKSHWTVPRQANDLYLGGVFNGKVLIVGKSHVRALSLARGEQLWNLEVGLLAGQGVATEKLYYLPLRSAAQTGEPEVCVIDIDRGVVSGHSKSRKKEVPGNLIFADSLMISQSLDQIAAFPQLKDKLEQIDQSLKANPKDPAGLVERGEVRLDRGDLQGAVDDLLLALKNRPPPEIETRARNRLHETLTEYLQRDFQAAEKYSKEYEESCKPDLEGAATQKEKQQRQTEARRRRANFLLLIGKGMESQRKVVEAFKKYMELSTLAGKDELISTLDEPAVRAAPDVWVQGRLRSLLDRARPEERKLLEDRIASRWKEIQDGKSLDDLRNFVALFGSLSRQSKEARLLLAERLVSGTDLPALLEAEQQLNLLRSAGEEPAVVARAVECLARLNIQREMLKDAAHYYRLLQRDFARVEVYKGRTGADIFDAAKADKRVLPFLEEPARLGVGKIRAREEHGAFPYQNQTYQLGQVGEKLPFFQENQFVVRYQPQSLRMLERASGEEKWIAVLDQTMFQHLVYGNGQPNSPKFPFLNLGHLIVLPLGHMVFGIDPINRKVLWKKNLHASSLSPGPAQANPPNHTQLIVDPRDGSILVTYADGWVQRLEAPMLRANVLCLQTRDALTGIDPLTGRTLWIRSDVSPRNQVFGDDQVLYVVEMNQENRPTTTRALRAYDGTSIKVPDFAPLFEKRVGRVGRTLAIAEPAPSGGTILRLYDVSTGKDVSKNEFPAGSVRLSSEDRNLAGMLEPDGKVRVVDLRTQKEVLTTKVDPSHCAGAQQIWLLSHGQDYYLAVNRPQNPQLMPFGPVQSNLVGGIGLRVLPVNGHVYCFNGADGKLRWYTQVPNQMLLLEHFHELPILLFASRFRRWSQDVPPREVIWHVEVRSIQKSNGKLLYDNNKIPNGMNFHALNIDAPRGKVELIGHQMKIAFHLNGEPAKSP